MFSYSGRQTQSRVCVCVCVCVYVCVCQPTEEEEPRLTEADRLVQEHNAWAPKRELLTDDTPPVTEQGPPPDTLTDMVSIMVNKLTYKPCLRDIMDRYYYDEMFRGKNEANKKDLFNSPDSPDHSGQITQSLTVFIKISC